MYYICMYRIVCVAHSGSCLDKNIVVVRSVSESAAVANLFASHVNYSEHCRILEILSLEN